MSGEFWDFLPLFLEEVSRKLPLRRPGIEHEIKLKPNLHPLFRPLYKLLQVKLKA
jgi:hypothetical protein